MVSDYGTLPGPLSSGCGIRLWYSTRPSSSTRYSIIWMWHQIMVLYPVLYHLDVVSDYGTLPGPLSSGCGIRLWYSTRPSIIRLWCSTRYSIIWMWYQIVVLLSSGCGLWFHGFILIIIRWKMKPASWDLPGHTGVSLWLVETTD